VLVRQRKSQQIARAYKIRVGFTHPIAGQDLTKNETYQVGNYCVHEGTTMRQLTFEELKREYVKAK